MLCSNLPLYLIGIIKDDTVFQKVCLIDGLLSCRFLNGRLVAIVRLGDILAVAKAEWHLNTPDTNSPLVTKTPIYHLLTRHKHNIC